MTEPQAERLANIVLGIAAAGAAFYILRTPALRRLAWGLARTAVTASGPAWLLEEVRRGWEDATPPASPTGRDMIRG